VIGATSALRSIGHLERPRGDAGGKVNIFGRATISHVPRFPGRAVDGVPCLARVEPDRGYAQSVTIDHPRVPRHPVAIAHDYNVEISNSRGPETLADLVKELGPKARAATPVDAAKAGDLVVVTVPLKNYRSVPVDPLAGKVVIDTNNYYPPHDRHISELDNESTTSTTMKVSCPWQGRRRQGRRKGAARHALPPG
jgi:hypothetical protein